MSRTRAGRADDRWRLARSPLLQCQGVRAAGLPALTLCATVAACSGDHTPPARGPTAPPDLVRATPIVEPAATAPPDAPREQLPPGVWESWDVNETKQWLLFREAPQPDGVILFVHGGPAMPTSVFSSSFDGPYLEHFHVAHWDQRGAGRSSLPLPPVQDLTIATYMRDAAVVARRLHARWPDLPLVVAGHSWGTVVAAELAAAHPEQVDHLVLMGTVVDVPAMQTVQFEQLVARGVSEQTIGAPPWDTLAKIIPVTRAVDEAGGSLGELGPHFGAMITASVDYTDDDRRAMGQGSRHTLPTLWPAVAAWRGPSGGAGFEMPVTFIHGADDLSTPLSLVIDYHARLDAKAGKDIFVRPGVAHFVMWEDNVAVARLLYEQVMKRRRGPP